MTALRIAAIATLTMALLPRLSSAEIYEYTDSSGVVHFVDDPAKIPAKLKKTVKKRGNDDSAEAEYEATKDRVSEILHNGTDEEIEKVIPFVRQEAQRGNPNALYDLGYHYQYGKGVEKNYKLAISYYQEAIALGHTMAMNNLGYMYHHGLGVRPNDDKALELWLAAAQAGNAFARQNIDALVRQNPTYDPTSLLYKKKIK